MSINEYPQWRSILVNKETDDDSSLSIPIERSGHSSVVYGNGMYIFGGMGKHRHNDLFRFDFFNQTWQEILPKDLSKVPSKRCKHSACIYNGMMYIFGGWDASGKLNDMYRYKFDTNEWEHVHCTNTPRARSAHSVVVYQNHMYLFGGIGDNKFNDMYRFSFKTNQWTMIEQQNAPPRRSSYGGANIFDDRLYIVCGLGCGKFNDCHVFDFRTSQWSEIKYDDKSAVIPAKRGRHTCVLHDEHL